jgi:DNA-binding response OmpR family regulator
MPTILVVDDDRLVRSMIEEVLKHRRFEVAVARNGQAGVELFGTGKFDAVVIDLFMPEMDGNAAIRGLRALDPSVPIIAMSGRTSADVCDGAPDFLAMAVKLGADCALQKPFRSDELVDAIRRGMANRAARAGVSSPQQNLLEVS